MNPNRSYFASFIALISGLTLTHWVSIFGIIVSIVSIVCAIVTCINGVKHRKRLERIEEERNEILKLQAGYHEPTK